MVAIILVLLALRSRTSIFQAISMLLASLPLAFVGFLLLLPQIAANALVASNSIATRLTMHIWIG